jgi:hypothetical protein
MILKVVLGSTLAEVDARDVCVTSWIHGQYYIWGG